MVRNGESGPEFVACQVCYEDCVLHTSFDANFKPTTQPQPAGDTWACGLAVPFIEKEMSVDVCPQRHKTLPYGRKWLVPKSRLAELVLCAACYCDKVLHTDEASKWKAAECWTRMCAACYVAIAEPIGVSWFFVRKLDVQPARTKWRCCLSVAHPCFGQFVQRPPETY
ncbi:hypothetical protein GGR53DRAFT_470658 [Hypoxylon sp. FL1150]|nr:hypothetical protein GGR53DRAFT_470658 [Hypoxylon sp. FL1150]